MIGINSLGIKGKKYNEGKNKNGIPWLGDIPSEAYLGETFFMPLQTQ